MRIRDLVTDIAELLQLQRQPVDQMMDTEIENRPDPQPAEPELVDRAAQETMIPPLQQKIELLKKAVDVDNFYDDGTKNSTGAGSVNLTINIPQGQSDTKIDLTINGQSVDELDQIKRLAGVPTASIFDAGDDEPLDS